MGKGRGFGGITKYKRYCNRVDVGRRPGDAGSGLGRRLCVETWTGAWHAMAL